MWFSSDVLWQLRIDLSVLAYSSCQQSRSGAPQIKSCNRRRKKDAATQSSMPTDFSDIKKDIKCCRNGYLVSEILPNGCWGDDISTVHRIQASLFRDQFIEEPWLGQPAAISQSVLNKNDGKIDIPLWYNNESKKARSVSKTELNEDFYNFSLSEIVGSKDVPHDDPFTSYPPAEEPWLLESSFGSCYSYTPDVLTQTETIPNVQNNFLVEDLPHKEETDVIPVEDSISTVILINSSICTLQRIAVLENDKLVELLLEPVKNNVQCDSVYLGIVSKLVPQMGGAFVNIGSSKLSFMDLNPNREPFIFFPFNANLKEMDRSTFDRSTLQMDISGTISCNDIADELDDLEDEQSEDEFIDVRSKGTERNSGFDLKIINGNVNGSITGSGLADQERSLPPSLEDLDKLGSKNFNQDAGVKGGSFEESLWAQVQHGSRIIVQVIKEGLGTKGPTVTAYPKLRSRFWVLSTRSNTIGISKKITGAERIRLKAIAKTLQPPGFGLTLRTVASSHTLEELKKDLEGLLSTWKGIVEHAKSAALAADEGVEGAVPVMLHRAMGQTLSVVQDYFNDKVMKMIVDSARTYHEVTKYLQDIDPNLCSRVELYSKRTPLFDEYQIEDDIDSILQKRVPLVNGGYLVIEQTEALVSIDVNGGQCMLGEGTSQEKAILEVNLVAAKQIARELRLRDIGGIIVVDFIDMEDDSNKRLVYEEMKKAAERDRSNVKVSELSRNGLMEITRKRVRPSVSFMISEPCSCCNATGRVKALETSFSKIEHEICRLLSTMQQKADPDKPKSWPRFILRVDRHMCNYLTCGKKTRLAVLSSSLKVWILLKVARGLARGAFELKALTEDNTHKKQHAVAISVLRPKELVTIKKWKTSGR